MNQENGVDGVYLVETGLIQQFFNLSYDPISGIRGIVDG
jgi:hypothetical protein